MISYHALSLHIKKMAAILDDKKFQKCQDMQYKKKMIQKKKNSAQ